MWDRVFPVTKDREKREADKQFVRSVLGYNFDGGFGSYDGSVIPARNKQLDLRGRIGRFSYHNAYNGEVYRVENPDALAPADKKGCIFLKYADTSLGAAVLYSPGSYKVLSFGFPLETIKDPESFRTLIKISLSSLED